MIQHAENKIWTWISVIQSLHLIIVWISQRAEWVWIRDSRPWSNLSLPQNKIKAHSHKNKLELQAGLCKLRSVVKTRLLWSRSFFHRSSEQQGKWSERGEKTETKILFFPHIWVRCERGTLHSEKLIGWFSWRAENLNKRNFTTGNSRPASKEPLKFQITEKGFSPSSTDIITFNLKKIPNIILIFNTSYAFIIVWNRKSDWKGKKTSASLEEAVLQCRRGRLQLRVQILVLDEQTCF